MGAGFVSASYMYMWHSYKEHAFLAEILFSNSKINSEGCC